MSTDACGSMGIAAQESGLCRSARGPALRSSALGLRFLLRPAARAFAPSILGGRVGEAVRRSRAVLVAAVACERVSPEERAAGSTPSVWRYLPSREQRSSSLKRGCTLAGVIERVYSARPT
jgi:hypothetical protein